MSLLLVACQQADPTDGDANVASESLLTHGHEARPDIVLFLVDGLRAGSGRLDTGRRAFIETLGHPVNQSFNAAYSPSPRPQLALASVLTGRYPSGIPLCGHPRFLAVPEDSLLPPLEDYSTSQAPWCESVPDDVPTLPEVLGLYGYRSAFVSSEEPQHPSLIRGFDRAILPPDGDMSAQSWWETSSEQAMEWWRDAADKPRLLVMQAPLDLGKTRALAAQICLNGATTGPEYQLSAHDATQDLGKFKSPIGGTLEGADAWELMDPSYAAAAASSGEQIGRFLSDLDENTGVVETTPRVRWAFLTALRGTHLCEWSGTDCPFDLASVGGDDYPLERILHVPLEIVAPIEVDEAMTSDRPTELVDLLPTLAHIAGAEPPARCAGRNLLHSADEPEPAAYAEYGDMLVLRKGSHIMVFRKQSHGISSLHPALSEAVSRDDPMDETITVHLYDVMSDPLQTNDISQDEPELMLSLHDTMARIRLGPGSPPVPIVSQEQLDALQRSDTLGYW